MIKVPQIRASWPAEFWGKDLHLGAHSLPVFFNKQNDFKVPFEGFYEGSEAWSEYDS